MMTAQSVDLLASRLLPLVICKVESCPILNVILPVLVWSISPYFPTLCHGGGVLVILPAAIFEVLPDSSSFSSTCICPCIPFTLLGMSFVFSAHMSIP